MRKPTHARYYKYSAHISTEDDVRRPIHPYRIKLNTQLFLLCGERVRQALLAQQRRYLRWVCECLTTPRGVARLVSELEADLREGYEEAGIIHGGELDLLREALRSRLIDLDGRGKELAARGKVPPGHLKMPEGVRRVLDRIVTSHVRFALRSFGVTAPAGMNHTGVWVGDDPSTGVTPPFVSELLGADDDGDLVGHMSVLTEVEGLWARVTLHFRYPSVDAPVLTIEPASARSPWAARTREEDMVFRSIIEAFQVKRPRVPLTGPMLAETDQILRLSELTDVSTSRNSHKGRKRAGEITIESMIELCRAKGVRNNTGRMTRDQERAIALYWQTGHPEWLQIAARLAYELEQELVGFKYDLPPAEPPRLVGPGLENPGDVYRRMPLNYHRSIDALRVVLREHAHYGEETAEDFEPRGKDRWSEHMRQLVPEIQRVAEHLRAIKSNQSVLRAALAKQRRKLTEQERREVHYAHRLLDEWSEHWQKVFRQISEIQALYEEVDPQALAEAIGHESAAIRAYMQANASRLSDAALIECAYQHFDGRHTTGGVLALVRGRIPRIFGEASDVLYFSGEKAYLFFTRGEHIPVESGIFEVDGYDVQDDSIVVVYDGKPYVLYPTSEVPTQKRLRFYKYAGAPSRVAVLAQD